MRRRGRRGQALVVAIFILAFLTAIAVAFYTSTTLQLRQSLNVANRVQASQAAEAGVAMAIAFLRHDGIIHQTYTSYDFAFSTYFNGAAFADKDWAFPGGASWVGGGADTVPQIPVSLAADLGDALYIPRQQDADHLDFAGPFVVDQAVGAATPAEQIDQWADVDNNEDGFKDSVWLPVPRDRLFIDDGIDNDLDGLVDEGQGMGEDGIDNDSDGDIDDNDERVTLAESNEPERGIFVYYGGNDSLDNDGDGLIDEDEITDPGGGEDRLFLTAPIRDGAGNDIVPPGTIAVRVQWEAPNYPTTVAYAGVGPVFTVDVSDVDVLDNDFDLVVNNSMAYGPFPDPTGVWTPVHQWDIVTRENNLGLVVNAFNDINPVYLTPLGYAPDEHLTSSGEPVCEVVGRVAVLVEDATAKANLNVINTYGHEYSSYYKDRMDPATPDAAAPNPPIARNLDQGLDVSEWDARVLPLSGVARSENVAQMRTGAPGGDGLSVTDAALPVDPLEYDLGFPGYGRVDDNGNALWASITGIDWDGNGWPYDGVIPYDYDGVAGFEFPNLQGIDEPQEYSPYRTPRNLVAETDGVDNESDNLIDEFGEIGDWYYRTNRQLPLVDGIATVTTREWRPLTIAHNFSRGDRFSYFYPDATLREEPLFSGLRLDYNYALAEQVKEMLSEDWGYNIGNTLLTLGLSADAEMFSVGLLRENVAVEPLDSYTSADPLPKGILAGEISVDLDTPDRFPTDTGLRALQLAANLVDQRDPDHVRHELSSIAPDTWWTDVVVGTPRVIEYEAAGIESIRINELMVRPVRRIEAELDVELDSVSGLPVSPYLYPNYFQHTGTTDFDIVAETFDDHLGVGKVPADFPTVAGTPTSNWARGGTSPEFLGERAYVTTDERYLENVPDTDPELNLLEPAPDVVQYLFAPSVQLPPGRYYMVIDTKDGDGNSTVDESWNLEYAVKYCRRVEPDPDPAVTPYPTFSGKTADWDDIIDDVYEEFYPDDIAAPNPEVPWQPVDPYLMGDIIKGQNEAQLDGKIFLATRLVGNATPVIPGYEQDDAYTVEIPPVAADPAEQIFLCVAFKIGDAPDPTPEIAINFFEFSQEPDHEWIELTNIAEAPDWADIEGDLTLFNATLDDAERQRYADKASVDVSGWQLDIGIEGRSDHTTLKLPADTFIAPGGTLLVCVNKYDRFAPLAPGYIDPTLFDIPLIFQNGMGLATSPYYAWLSAVTSPPIPNPLLTPALESVFYRVGAGVNPPVDFVDLPSTFWDDFLQSSPDLVDPLSGATLISGPDQAWDRIVEAEVVVGSADEMVLISGDAGSADIVGGTFTVAGSTWTVNQFAGMFLGQGNFYWRITSNTADTLTLEEYPDAFGDLVDGGSWRIITEPPRAIGRIDFLSDVRQLAKLILRGGILPNYPEHDGIDNDGDNSQLQEDEVDNNGDGAVEETLEGVDEGRKEVWENSPTPRAAPGDYSIYSVEYDTIWATYAPGDPAAAYPDAAYPAYLGTWQDHPEWKAFVERRMFPGDVVTVTLYNGTGEDKRVVDQVTYTEKDVVNRAIDDALDCPFISDIDGDGDTTIDFNGTTDAFQERPTLDPRFISWWPDNTMGIDFYRSIPRKHPFYTGDRFGVANRWTATDGAYDDWADSFGPLKDSTNHWLSVAGAEAEYGHAFAGTPLRKNVFEKLLNLGPTGGVLDPDPVSPDWDTEFAPGGAQEGSWGLAYQTVRNRSFPSAEQILNMPHLMMREQLSTSSGAGTDYAFAQDVVERALVGQPDITTFAPDSAALTSHMANDNLVLTCAQADFYPLFPRPDDIAAAATAGDNYHQWDTATSTLPNPWVPIFLYSLDDSAGGTEEPGTDKIFSQPPFPVVPDSMPAYWAPADNALVSPWQVQMNFLLAQPANFPLAAYPAALQDRWPLWERPVMYVSANMPGFDPNLSRVRLDDPAAPLPLLPRPTYADFVGGDPAFEQCPAEALFVWDADDGLEDGEYDVYVLTAGSEMDLLSWGQEIAAARAGTLTDLLEPTFGPDFLAALRAEDSLLSDRGMDIEFYTDRGLDTDGDGVRDAGFGNGRVWDDVNANFFPEPGELLNGPNQESFGMRYGATPNREGVIHYGVVNVENNYLALRLRNWAAPGILNTFSRVVLAPRVRSYGRININTAKMEPRYDDSGDPTNDFNPLMGIPGVLADFNPATGAFTFLPDDTDYGNLDLDDSRALAATIVAGRFAWPDGRYYRSVSDLLSYTDSALLGGEVPPLLVSPLITNVTGDAETDYVEETGRYARMLNLISIYSDVFEINVTAQSGYIANQDVNGDGQIDWRYDFVTTAEKKVRTIYER